MMNNAEKRCKQCGKILVSDSKIGLCPKCADKDARGAVEIGVGAIGIGLIVKKLWKPGVELVKGIAKVITKA